MRRNDNRPIAVPPSRRTRWGRSPPPRQKEELSTVTGGATQRPRQKQDRQPRWAPEHQRCGRSAKNRSGKHPPHPRVPLKLSVVAQRPREKETKANAPHTRHQVPPVVIGGGALRSGPGNRRRPTPPNHPPRTARDQLVADLRWRASQNRMTPAGTQAPPDEPPAAVPSRAGRAEGGRAVDEPLPRSLPGL